MRLFMGCHEVHNAYKAPAATVYGMLQDNAKTMKVQLDAQVKAVDQLKGNTRMLENKLTEAKSKKDTLKARAKSASTSKQINEMLQGLNTSSASSAFDRMEEKVMALEGESEAAMQVRVSTTACRLDMSAY